jgi:DNA transformation protein
LHKYEHNRKDMHSRQSATITIYAIQNQLFAIQRFNMKPHDEFVEYLLELMQPLGPVSAKAMFGGYGIYIDDLMFAIVADDVLYLKTGTDNRPEFEQRGLLPFTYIRDGKTCNMSYSEAPAEVLDDPDTMKAWANSAIEAALKNRKATSGK